MSLAVRSAGSCCSRHPTRSAQSIRRSGGADRDAATARRSRICSRPPASSRSRSTVGRGSWSRPDRPMTPSGPGSPVRPGGHGRSPVRGVSGIVSGGARRRSPSRPTARDGARRVVRVRGDGAPRVGSARRCGPGARRSTWVRSSWRPDRRPTLAAALRAAPSTEAVRHVDVRFDRRDGVVDERRRDPDGGRLRRAGGRSRSGWRAHPDRRRAGPDRAPRPLRPVEAADGADRRRPRPCTWDSRA